jgi:cell division protein FtsA
VAEADAMAGGHHTRRVWLALNGTGISTGTVHGTTGIRAPDQRITGGDLGRAVEAAATFGQPMHRILISTAVDGAQNLEDPIGRTGKRLEAHFLVIEAAREREGELRQALSMAGLEVQGIIAGALAAATVLTPAEREIGGVVLDMGAHHTSAAVYARGGPRHLAVVRYGGIHVTRDLAVAMGLPVAKAERLKLTAAPTGEGFANKAIAARVKETLELVRMEIAKAGWDGRLPGGYVLTGGGALLPGLPEAAAEILRAPVRLGLPQLGRSMETIAGPAFAVILGLAGEAGRMASSEDYGHRSKGVGRWRLRFPRDSSPVSK